MIFFKFYYQNNNQFLLKRSRSEGRVTKKSIWKKCFDCSETGEDREGFEWMASQQNLPDLISGKLLLIKI